MGISILNDLRNFVPFVHFQKREKQPWSCVTFSKGKRWGGGESEFLEMASNYAFYFKTLTNLWTYIYVQTERCLLLVQSPFSRYCLIPALFSKNLLFPRSCDGFLTIASTFSIKSQATKQLFTFFVYILILSIYLKMFVLIVNR